MQTLFDLLRTVTEALGIRIVYTILMTTFTVFTATIFLLSNFPAFRQRLANVFGGQKGLYTRYFSALTTFLSLSKLIFYVGEREGSPRRSFRSIYLTFLAIALGYTAVLFFLGWTSGGSGALGHVRVIVPDYSVPMRLLIAAGFGALAYFVWVASRNSSYLNGKVNTLLKRAHIPVSSDAALAFVGASLALVGFLIGMDRHFLFPPDTAFFIQLVLATAAFYAIWQGYPPILAFAYVTTAAYGFTLGIPILIGAPLAVAVATAIAGNKPLILSTILVPLLMLVHYYALPTAFQNSPEANFVLAGIACLPLFLAVFIVSLQQTSWPRAAFYTAISVFPVWVPVSASTKQITDPVAFAVVVFWFLIPVLNALWDSISWALTWHLLDHLRRSLDKVRDSQIGRFAAAIQRLLILVGHVLINLLTSAILFVVTFFVIIAAIRVVNLIIEPIHPDYMIDVVALLKAVQQDPYSGDGLWLVSMVFVTLVPALVHLCLVFVSALMISIGPSHVVAAWSILQRKDEDIDAKEFRTSIRIVAGYLAISTAFFATTLLLLWSAYWRYASGQTIGDYLMSVGVAALRLTEVFITK